MAMLPLRLPTIQNWSCHNCSGCCHQHLIEITDEERQRILDQNWKPSDGIPAGRPVVVPHRGSLFRKSYRLVHQANGACVFLRDDGLCRIHAKFGEPAKPLACRIYPYAFHPAGGRVTVSLRFSCPSVVANKGKSVVENRDELKAMQKLVVPEGVEHLPPPNVSRREKVDWKDFMRFVDCLDEVMSDDEEPFIARLFQCLQIVELIEQSRFHLVGGSRLSEFLNVISDATSEGDLPDAEKPNHAAMIQFRLLVAYYARKDTVADLDAGIAGRWRLLRAATRFASGRGNATPLQDCFREVPFETIEQPFGELPDGTEEILTRYLRVKLQGLHFCGAAYYDVPFCEGFQSLTLIIPSIFWLARWLAASNGRSTLVLDDISQALAIADHHHGYSPVFGSGSFRRRVRLLASSSDIARLLLWYAQ